MEMLFFLIRKNSKVTSNKIIFDRNQNTISSFGKTSVNIFDNSNKNIEFKVSGENAIINRNTKTLEITDNVILNDMINEMKILSDKIIYNQIEEVLKVLIKQK